MPTALRGEGDSIVARRIVYLARKVAGPRLVRKSGQHRGLWGTLYDAEAYVDLPLEGIERSHL